MSNQVCLLAPSRPFYDTRCNSELMPIGNYHQQFSWAETSVEAIAYASNMSRSL